MIINIAKERSEKIQIINNIFHCEQSYFGMNNIINSVSSVVKCFLISFIYAKFFGGILNKSNLNKLSFLCAFAVNRSLSFPYVRSLHPRLVGILKGNPYNKDFLSALYALVLNRSLSFPYVRSLHPRLVGILKGNPYNKSFLRTLRSLR